MNRERYKSLYRIFDRTKLRLLPLKHRKSDLAIDYFQNVNPTAAKQLYLSHKIPNLDTLANCIITARKKNKQVILMLGSHVIRAGVSKYIIDLMEKKFITHIAMNGSGPIHEFELARFSRTTESVARYIKEGQFGLWKETGKLNDIILRAYKDGLGFGEAVGKFIYNSSYKYKDFSILAAGYRLKIPVTVHVGIGYDIVHEHPNCNGAAIGETSYRDFLIFAETVKNLEGGVLLCFGSAVMAPEVFLKALAMARNVAHQNRKKINNFTTAVFDLCKIKKNYHKEAAKSEPGYYFRPWKTLLVRTVANGGKSFYFRIEHRISIPILHYLVLAEKSHQQDSFCNK